MLDRKILEPICKNVNKYEARLQKYLIHTTQDLELNSIPSEINNENVDNEQETKEIEGDTTKVEVKECEIFENELSSSKKKVVKIDKCTRETFAMFAEEMQNSKAKSCTWLYGQPNEIEKLMSPDCSSSEIRKAIDEKMQNEYPKGISRILMIELMYSVIKYCQKYKHNLQQCGTILSLFFLTHQWFLLSLNTSTAKVYYIFKEHMLLHCIDCPPDSRRLFNYEESKNVMQYFCTIYLKNLPLIRLLALPNFGFCLNYQKPPDLFEEKASKKGKKDKKDKGSKKGKKSKK